MTIIKRNIQRPREYGRNGRITVRGNVASLGAGSFSSSVGGGSWLEAYFELDENNNVRAIGNLFAGGNISATGEVSAFAAASPPDPNWWDSMPYATATSIGGVQVINSLVAYENGIRLNTTTKKLEIDPTYATGATWGPITGTLSDQLDLQAALDAKLGDGEKAADSELLDGIDSTGFLGRINAPDTNIDNFTTDVFYTNTGGTVLGTLPSGGNNARGVIHMNNHAGSYYAQLMMSSGDDSLYYRSKNGGSWTSWRTIYHSGNDGSLLKTNVNDETDAGIKTWFGGAIIGQSSSAARIQVNGFIRTGNIYLHSGGNTPTDTRTSDVLGNNNGSLEWRSNTVWTALNSNLGTVNWSALDLIGYNQSINTAPSGGTTKLNGYGIIGNRSVWYITNSFSGGNIRFGISGAHAANTTMIMDNAGLSINTGAVATEAFDVNGNIKGNGNILIDSTNNGYIKTTYNSGYAQMQSNSSGGYISATNSSGTTRTFLSGYGDSYFNGNLSIGKTTAATEALDVVGNGLFKTTSGNPTVTVEAADNLSKAILIAFNNYGGELALQDNSGDSLVTLRGYDTANGGWIKNNLAIGKTSTPTEALDVNGNAKVSGVIYGNTTAAATILESATIRMRNANGIGVIENIGSSNLYVYGGAAGAGTHSIYMGSDYTNDVRINTSLSVGGLHAPTEALDVVGRGKFTATGGNMLEIVYNAGQTGYIRGVKNSANNWYVGNGSTSNDELHLINYQSANLNFGTGGAVKMILTNSGYLRIGNNSAPTEALDVAGNIAVSGMVYNGYKWTTHVDGFHCGTDGNNQGLSFFDGTGSSARIYRSGDKFYVGARGGTTTSGITITSAGLVGVGIITPSEALDVVGNIQLTGNLQRTAHHTGHLEGSYNNVGSNGYKSNPIYTIGSGFNPTDAALSNMYGVGFANGSQATFLSSFGGSWGMYIAANGTAKIFLDAFNGDIHCTNDIDAGGDVTAGGEVTAFSDIRLKSDLKVISSPLERLSQLSGYTYTKDDRRSAGIIAQDVQKVLPEAVHGEETEDTYLSVNYAAVVALLIEANKESLKRIEKLEKQIQKS